MVSGVTLMFGEGGGGGVMYSRGTWCDIDVWGGGGGGG